MSKRVFLLEKAVRLPIKEPLGEYNSTQSLNMTLQNGRQVAIVSIVGAPPTFSKTMAYPGDDDPDPGQEQCY